MSLKWNRPFTKRKRAPANAGWAMFTGWAMDASPRIYSTASLPLGARRRGCPPATCKRDMKACNIDTKSWEALVDNRNLWKQQVSQGLKRREFAIGYKNDKRRARRITCQHQDHPDPQPASVFICKGRSRDCKSKIGLYSNAR